SRQRTWAISGILGRSPCAFFFGGSIEIWSTMCQSLEDARMESIDNLRERFEALAQRTEQLPQPCPHCDQPDSSLLRLVLMGESLRADETLLVPFADVLQQSGLLHLSDKPKDPHVR